MSIGYLDIANKTRELNDTHGRATVVALLAKYGVKYIKDLKEEHYRAYFVEADNMIHHHWDEIPPLETAPVAKQVDVDINVHTTPCRRPLWLDVLLFPYILFSVTTFAVFMMGYALWKCYVKRRDVKVGW